MVLGLGLGFGFGFGSARASRRVASRSEASSLSCTAREKAAHTVGGCAMARATLASAALERLERLLARRASRCACNAPTSKRSRDT